MLLHDVLDERVVILTEQQRLDRDHADQLMAARDIAGVDRLLVDARAADAQNRLADGHVRAQGDIFGRHDRAGRILRIAQDLIDLLAHLRLRLAQNPLDDVGRHFFDDVDGVVDVQLVDDLLQLRVREAADQQLLRLRLHLDERLRRQLLRQQPEQQRQPRLVQLVEHGGDVRRVHRAENVPQRMIFLIIQQLDQGFFNGKIVFCHGLSS